jgi:hypothetical protein
MSEDFRPGSVAEKKEKQAQSWIGWKLEKTLLIVGGLNVCCKFEHDCGARVEQDR